uniref:Uncharacterized protein n=1 Tax=Pithovirus LCPAC403 TaxID=2506596 RepID=A0A481ZDP6_9VIRU|nr:MAG: hypothetical protein LCPAC403_03030 [Pithovirus LCPAC403]
MTVNLNPRDLNTSYLLFSLKTRMLFDIEDTLGESITVRFDRHLEYDRYDVLLYKGDVKQVTSNIDKLQSIIDYWMINRSNECLLMSDRFKIDDIPSSWIKDMISTINIFDHPTSIENGRLYIELDPAKDYSESYTNFNLKVVDSLKTKYDEGYVYDFGSIAKDWNLESLGHNYFKPRWDNCMYARNIVSFLTQRFTGQKKVCFDLGTDSNVVRHFIAQGLDKCLFVGDRLIFEIDTFDNAESLSKYVKTSIKDAHGTVKLEVYRPHNILNRLGKVFYRTDDIHFPLTISHKQ